MRGVGFVEEAKVAVQGHISILRIVVKKTSEIVFDCLQDLCYGIVLALLEF